jgi:hypothetical protein
MYKYTIEFDNGIMESMPEQQTIEVTLPDGSKINECIYLDSAQQLEELLRNPISMNRVWPPHDLEDKSD